MKNRQHFKPIISIFAILPFVLFLISCGGGGGGGSDDGNTPAISYTGSTTQASITENNATDLSTESYTNGSLGSSMSGIAAGQTENSNQDYSPRMLKVSNALKDSLLKLDLTSGSSGTHVRAVQQGELPNGNCGGSASYTINVNDQTGAFSGSFTYNNYCENGVIISGSVEFSGQYDADAQQFLTFEFSFNNLSTTIGGDSVTIKGEVLFNVTDATVVLTMDILIKDSNNDVYWVNDYQLTITQESACLYIDISGTFYHPEHGFVVLSTVQTLTLCGSDEYPESGELLISGKDGTTARITFLSPTTYRVLADTNGNGSYNDPDDFDSGISNWSDL